MDSAICCGQERYVRFVISYTFVMFAEYYTTKKREEEHRTCDEQAGR